MMKEIFVISLDDDIPLSSIINSDMHKIASFLYDELDRYDKYSLCLRYDSSLIRNELFEVYASNGNVVAYQLDSDSGRFDSRLYEPFMIGNTSFGFTAYEGTINENDIRDAINSVLRFVKCNYTFRISSIKYVGNNRNDRYKAIDTLAAKLHEKDNKKLVRKKTKSIFPMLKI